MTLEEIKKLGTDLGLEFSHNIVGHTFAVCFDLANGQRAIIYSQGVSDNKIIKALGDALVTKGKILKKLEINRILSITNPD